MFSQSQPVAQAFVARLLVSARTVLGLGPLADAGSGAMSGQYAWQTPAGARLLETWDTAGVGLIALRGDLGGARGPPSLDAFNIMRVFAAMAVTSSEEDELLLRLNSDQLVEVQPQQNSFILSLFPVKNKWSKRCRFEIVST